MIARLPVASLLGLLLTACASPAAPLPPSPPAPDEAVRPSSSATGPSPLPSSSVPPVASAGSTTPAASAAPPSPPSPPPPASTATLNGVSISQASLADIQQAFEKAGWKSSVQPEHVTGPQRAGRYEVLFVRVHQMAGKRETRAFGIALARHAKEPLPVVEPAKEAELAPAELRRKYDSAILDFPHIFDEKADVLVAGMPIGMPSKDVQAILSRVVVKPK